MSVWQYKAAAGDAVQRGELAADTAADVRAALRAAGLRVIHVRPLRREAAIDLSFAAGLSGVWRRHVCSRRASIRAELFDAAATMLNAGIPLLEAVATVRRSHHRRSTIAMLAQVHERLQSGSSLAEALATQPTWFEPTEVAMVEAGQSTGDLPAVLSRLADRRAQSGELASKLAAALTYPAIVLCVALGVTIFLSTRTLPDLSRVLTQADIQPPALTSVVMDFGQAVLHFGLPALAATVVVAILAALAASWIARQGWYRWHGLERPVPRTIRRLAAAEALLSLAELTRSGVPVVDALRVVSPTTPAWLSLRLHLNRTADDVERGQPLAESLAHPLWFDEEITRLISVGETTGELDDVLERVGRREQRRSRRLIDRLAALLEPAAILTLAVLVGTVVLAAVLPLIRLQEIIH